MVSKRSGKHATSESQRVPSTVPNDYDHLGVPGSLNLALTPTGRRRRHRRGTPTWIKALLAVAGGTAAFGVVLLVIFIIAFPPFFRNLEPRYQQRLIDMFPPFDSLRPTVPFEVLPTLGGSSDSQAAQQLLLLEDASPTPASETPDAVQGMPVGDEGRPTVAATLVPTATPSGDAGGIPVGQVGTTAPTMLPTYIPPTQAALATITPAYSVTEAPLPKQVKLDHVRYEAQGWNNCGPTTMTMALSYYGWSDNQETAANWMKPNKEDKNVSPWQMVRFVYENTGVKALYRFGGTTTVLKRLLAANFPVVIEESIQPANEGWMGHYVLLIGYDDYEQSFLTFDSYLGSNQQQGRPSPYSLFDEKWRHFNRVFIVLYEPSREMDLRAALGDYVDPEYGYHTALDFARSEAKKDGEDKWAWFNMGSSYVGLKEYENASYAYDEAFRLGLPFRMLWYQFGPYEAYLHTERYSDVIARAQNTITTTPYVEESYYYQGLAYAAQGDTQAAVAKLNEALRYNKNFFPAQEAKAQVEAGTFTVANAP